MKFRIITSIIILVLLAALFLAFGACKGNLKHGYRSVILAGNTRDAVSKAMVEVCSKKHQECLKDKTTYKVCISKCKAALVIWTKDILPGINASLKVTVGVLEAAYQKKEKDANWIRVLKPAICGIMKAFNEFKHLLGEKLKKLEAGFKFAEKVVCNGN